MSQKKPSRIPTTQLDQNLGTCALAEKDGFEWVWIESCCIDKRGSTELSEAIKSMARWYREAQISYFNLSDVPSVPEKWGESHRRTPMIPFLQS